MTLEELDWLEQGELYSLEYSSELGIPSVLRFSTFTHPGDLTDEYGTLWERPSDYHKEYPGSLFYIGLSRIENVSLYEQNT